MSDLEIHLPKGYAHVLSCYIEHPDVDSNTLRVFCYLVSKHNIKNWKFSVVRISKNLPLTENTVRKCVQKLEKLGWLEREEISSRCTKYIVYADGLPNSLTPKVCPPKFGGLKSNSKNKISRKNKKTIKKQKEKTHAKENINQFLHLLPEDYKRDREFMYQWKQWCEFRKIDTKSWTKRIAIANIKRLSEDSNLSPKGATQVIAKSLELGWKGLFPPDEIDLEGTSLLRNTPKKNPFMKASRRRSEKKEAE